MAVLKKIKKGGVARWAIYGLQQNDSFTVPRGCRIRYIGVETLKTVAGGTNQVAIGSALGVVPVQTLTTNGTAVGGSGTSVTIDGIAVTVAQLDTASTVMDKIMAAYAAGSFTNAATTSGESWTMVRTSANVITITGNLPKTQTAVVIAVGSITGFTLTSAQVVAGSVDASVVNATTVSNYAVDYPGQNSLVALTVQANKDYLPATHSPNIYNTFTAFSSTTVGSFVINGTTFTPKTAATSDVTGIAKACADAVNASTTVTGLTAFNVAGQLVIGYAPTAYGTTPSAPLTYSFAGITGATPGAVTTTYNVPELTYYVSISGQYAKALEGNLNLYVILDKLN